MDKFVRHNIRSSLRFYERMQKRMVKQLRELKEYDGTTLSVFFKKGQPYYHTVVKGQRKYVRKCDYAKIPKIQTHFFLTKALEITNQNIGILQFCDNHLRSIDPDHLMRSFPKAYQRDTSDYYRMLGGISKAEFLKRYQTDESFYPKGRTEPTKDGRYVRTKSEVLWTSELISAGFLYVYEPSIFLFGIEIHPDFVIWSPLDGRVIIVEHFGMMDDASYRSTTYQKITTYLEAGFVLHEDLLFTFETKEHPLNINMIKSVLMPFMDVAA